jgi:outer membrane receptor protein involved in Fe transport
MGSQRRSCMFGLVLLLLLAPQVRAQVTTATLYGIVTDPSGAVLPGVEVTLTSEGTAAVRQTVTGETGEFVFTNLPVGSYALKLSFAGFKTAESKGIQLAAGQNVRSTYTLEVGGLAETVTVQGGSPLVNTVSAEQRESLSTVQVTELPLSRRNVTSILRLSSGADVGGGSVRINGQGKSGAGVTVDGTDANSNPSEGRAMEQYGGANYIDVMSIEAIQEVQLMRGIMAAEYGGVVSGQVNLISKSGTNRFHGSLFENYRSHLFNARNPFQVSRNADGSVVPKNREVFNQFGGSLGGPVLRDRVFFFTTYEGYRESTFSRVNGNVPTPSLRSEILSALPFQETRLLLDTLPEPTVPLSADLGRFEGAGQRQRTENHVVARGDVLLTKASSLTFAYTRNRPFGLDPRFNLNGSNDRTYQYAQDRATAQYTLTRAAWVSETRFGWNNSDMDRLDKYFTFVDPKTPEKVEFQRRIPRLAIQSIATWGSAEVWHMDGATYSLDEKIALHHGKHLFKVGGRYIRYTGSRTNPENPSYSFNNKADMAANLPGTTIITYGSHGPHKSRMYEFGFFAQDDWRLSNRLVLNLGLRYDYYSNDVVESTGSIPVRIVNPDPPSDWGKFDFGPVRPFDKPTESDGWSNLGPRFGFAFNPDGRGKTVIRGGYGILFAAQVPALLRQSVAHPVVPFRLTWTRAEAQSLGVRFPMYAEDTLPIAERDVAATGRRLFFSVINPDLQNPYTMNYQLNVQRSLGQDLMVELGYVGVRGVKFPMHRRVNLPDRVTGIRPNPKDIVSGYYVDNSESTLYSSMQLSLRRRFSRNFSFDAHYTYGYALAYIGGDVGVYYGTDAQDTGVQDFYNVRAERGPSTGDVRHRFVSDFVYELPYLLGHGNAVLRHALGGWQASGIVSARTGGAVTITQSCSSNYFCRPDYVGGDIRRFIQPQEITTGCRTGVHCDVQYLTRDAFVRIPVAGGVAARPGNASKSLVRNPGAWGVDLTLAKNFKVREAVRLQYRVDMFNALNHLNLGGIASGNIDSADFGRINGAGGMRAMQMGLRLQF